MKTKLNLKSLITNSLIAVFVLAASTASIAEDINPSELKNFKVVVERTEKGIKIHSLEGSAWIDLTCQIKDNQAQAIDEYGMTELNKVSADKDATLADFLFTITKTKNGIVLKGIEGTAWTDLSYSLPLNNKQTIDQFGLTDLN